MAGLAGNIDLDSLKAIRNPDGSISTVRSMSFSKDGVEILVPTMDLKTGRRLTTEQSVSQFRRTGKFLGKFRTAQEATEFAKSLSRSQGERIMPGKTAKEIATAARRKKSKEVGLSTATIKGLRAAEKADAKIRAKFAERKRKKEGFKGAVKRFLKRSKVKAGAALERLKKAAKKKVAPGKPKDKKKK